MVRSIQKRTKTLQNTSLWTRFNFPPLSASLKIVLYSLTGTLIFYIHAICNKTFMRCNLQHAKSDGDTILQQYSKLSQNNFPNIPWSNISQNAQNTPKNIIMELFYFFLSKGFLKLSVTIDHGFSFFTFIWFAMQHSRNATYIMQKAKGTQYGTVI